MRSVRLACFSDIVMEKQNDLLLTQSSHASFTRDTRSTIVRGSTFVMGLTGLRANKTSSNINALKCEATSSVEADKSLDS